MSRARSEVEHSFSLPPERVADFLSLLTPRVFPERSGLCVRGEEVPVRSMKLARRVHFYAEEIESERGAPRRRLNVSLESGAVAVRRVQKGFISRYEKREQKSPWRRGERALRALAQFDPVVAALAKYRATFEMGWKREKGFVVSIDRIVPFDAGDWLRQGSEHIHVELEGGPVGTERPIFGDAQLDRDIHALARPLQQEETKWRIAASMTPRPVVLAFASPEDLHERVAALFAAAFPVGGAQVRAL
jgi:hypothetical protein